MTLDSMTLEQRLVTLRREFDGAFSEPHRAAPATMIDLLGVRVAGQAYALRLADVSGVFADRPIVQHPSAVQELLGLCAARGSIVPVYDLGALLGHQRASAPRFFALVSPREPIGLAFDALDGQLRVQAEQIARAEPQPSTGSGAAGELAHEVVPGLGAVRPIVSMVSVIAAIERRLGLNIRSRSDEP